MRKLMMPVTRSVLALLLACPVVSAADAAWGGCAGVSDPAGLLSRAGTDAVCRYLEGVAVPQHALALVTVAASAPPDTARDLKAPVQALGPLTLILREGGTRAEVSAAGRAAVQGGAGVAELLAARVDPLLKARNYDAAAIEGLQCLYEAVNRQSDAQRPGDNGVVDLLALAGSLVLLLLSVALWRVSLPLSVLLPPLGAGWLLHELYGGVAVPTAAGALFMGGSLALALRARLTRRRQLGAARAAALVGLDPAACIHPGREPAAKRRASAE